MPNLYTRKLYEQLMSKLNISRYVKKQTSVTASELHDQRAKWEDAGMKLPAPLAAFHIGKPSLCTFWNHAKGAGCKREKDGKKCDRDHKCMWCGSTTHGAYMRVAANSGSGVYQCPFYEGIRVELQSLGIDATISDLDDFVEDLRTHGVPPDALSGSSGASTAPVPRSIAKSSSSVSSTIVPGAAKEHHVPVGGVPVNRTKNTKRAKKDAAMHPSGSLTNAPSLIPSSSTSVNPIEAHSSLQMTHPHHPGPISKPSAPSVASHLSSSNPSEPLHISMPSSDVSVLGTSPSQMFESPSSSSSLFDNDVYDHNGHPAYYNGLTYSTGEIALIGDRLGPTGFSTGPLHPPIYPVPTSEPEQASPSTSGAMHLAMNASAYEGDVELRIHSPLHRTPRSLIYGTTYTHSWLTHPSEIIVKLVLLSQDPIHRQKQHEKLESEYRVYTTFGKLNHPHLLPVLGRESVIESGVEQYALLAMEKADFNLAQYFHDFLPHNMALFQHHLLFQQQMSSGQPSTLPSMTPLYRALSNQLINTFLLLHLHDRYHQRSIDPSNIYVSSSAVPGYSTLTLDKETPSLKISDFSFIQPLTGAGAAGSNVLLGGGYSHGFGTLVNSIDAQYQGFLSPEASRANVPFGNLVHPGSIAGASQATHLQPLHHQYAAQPPFDGKASDLFSIGCALYYIVSGGHVLFASERERDDEERRTAYLKRHHVDKSDPMLLDVINRLTLPRPDDRPPLDVIRHHPALWKPHAVVDFISMISTELERSKSNLASLIWDIIGSNEFFSHAFPKATNWRDHVPASWIASWMDWAQLQLASHNSTPINAGKASANSPSNGSLISTPLIIVPLGVNEASSSGPGALNFRSIRQLLRCLTISADHLPGGVASKNEFGNTIIRRLHFLVISLWSHLQQIGTFDESHKFSFIA